MNITIEKYDVSMLDECVDLYMKTYATEPWNEEWDSRDVVVDYISKWTSNNFFIGFVGKQNEKIIALCFGYEKPYTKGTEYYINDYIVDPDFQQQGVGTILMADVKKELAVFGIPAIMLSTQKGIPAHTFYEKLDFFTLEDTIVMVGDV